MPRSFWHSDKEKNSNNNNNNNNNNHHHHHHHHHLMIKMREKGSTQHFDDSMSSFSSEKRIKI